MERIVHLETEHGKFPVIDMVRENDRLVIFLPNRTSIQLLLLDGKIKMFCDLGIEYDDMVQIGHIDLSERDYESQVVFSPKFFSRALSYENDFHINKFVEQRARMLANGYTLSPGEVLASDSNRVSQVYINLTEDASKKLQRNLEFSLYRADYIDEDLLEEPIFTLASSLKFDNNVAHWFFFIAWSSSNLLRYDKNVFYNNTSFSDKIFKSNKTITI